MQAQESYSPTVLSIREATPLISGLVLGPLLQERHGGPGEGPKKGSEAGNGSGEEATRGVAEGSGVV